LAAVAIAVPPLAEQRRIVETVEALLTQVNAAADSLAQVSLILRRFRQSVFAAACSGKLTADWRNDPEPRSGAAGTVDGLFELPVEWTWRPFRDLLASIRSGSTAVPQLGVTPFPILRSSSVRRGVVDLQDVRYLRADQSESDANYISEGDLLFTRLSGSLDFVGNCARVPTLRGLRVQYPDRLFCGTLKEPREGEFFELVFRAPFIQKVLSELAKSSAGHQRISMGAITDILVPYPSPGEQDEIVRRVKGILAMAETIERRVVTSSARADALTHSILAKAFRGELVPIEAELARAEGRDYESAEALLARIHSKGAARVPTPKPRKTTSGAAS
jgi:type I restriction enzyme S subunit